MHLYGVSFCLSQNIRYHSRVLIDQQMPMSGPPRHTSANRRKSRPRKMFWRLKRKSPAIRSHYYRQLDQSKWKTYPTTVSEMFCFSETLESRFELDKRFQIQLVVDSPATDFFVKL